MKYSTKEIMNLYDEYISKLANDIENFYFVNDPYEYIDNIGINSDQREKSVEYLKDDLKCGSSFYFMFNDNIYHIFDKWIDDEGNRYVIVKTSIDNRERYLPVINGNIINNQLYEYIPDKKDIENEYHDFNELYDDIDLGSHAEDAIIFKNELIDHLKEYIDDDGELNVEINNLVSRIELSSKMNVDSEYEISVEPFEVPDLYDDGDFWFDYEIRNKNGTLICAGQDSIEYIDEKFNVILAYSYLNENIEQILIKPKLYDQSELMKYCVETVMRSEDGMCYVESDELSEYSMQQFEQFIEECEKYSLFKNCTIECSSNYEDALNDDPSISCYGNLATIFNVVSKHSDFVMKAKSKIVRYLIDNKIKHNDDIDIAELIDNGFTSSDICELYGDVKSGKLNDIKFQYKYSNIYVCMGDNFLDQFKVDDDSIYIGSVMDDGAHGMGL